MNALGEQRRHALDWPRADPGALAEFDPATKICVMNCGPHISDPRTNKERKFLCDDCYPSGPLTDSA